MGGKGKGKGKGSAAASSATPSRGAGGGDAPPDSPDSTAPERHGGADSHFVHASRLHRTITPSIDSMSHMLRLGGEGEGGEGDEGEGEGEGEGGEGGGGEGTAAARPGGGRLRRARSGPAETHSRSASNLDAERASRVSSAEGLRGAVRPHDKWRTSKGLARQSPSSLV